MVGGGAVALRKVRDLLSCGAHVHLVSPEWHSDFESVASNPRVDLSRRGFEATDLEGVFLAVAATDRPEVQEAVAREARRRGVLVNVVDVPDLCDFYLPANVRRGSLVVSVSTEGKNPAFAVAVRDRIEEGIDPGVASGLEQLASARALVRARYPQEPDRRVEALRRLLTPGAVDRLMEGRLEEFGAHLETWKESL